VNINTQFDEFAGEYKQILDRSLAASGEDSAYFAEYKARYLRRRLTPEFSGKVLDFGCGVGLLARFMRQSLPFARIDGFDVSRESIQKVGKELLEQGVFTSDVGHLGGDYQLIVVANVMHHVPLSQRPSTIEKLVERLASGGILAVFEHNPANPVTRWVVEHCPFDSNAVLLPPKETSAYLEQVGLRNITRDYIVFMPHSLAFLRPLEPSLKWLPLGAQYVTVAEKYV
jgi:SAM-dependent methyltransferase